jgi:tetratricopeptide (TPR) repeat protein
MLSSGQFDRAIIALGPAVGTGVDDTIVRLIRARAYLGKGDSAGALSDLNSILAVRPDDVPALTMRGLVFTAQHDYAKALADLDQAIAKQETIEDLAARAGVFEARNEFDKAAADLRRATELAPKNVFEAATQNAARQKLQQLAKRIPCGSAGSAKGDGTCL